MNELVFKSEKGNPVTTSLLVAEKFQKRHADVLRAIDNLECSTGFRQRNFAFAENQLIGAAKERLCVMNKDGFSFLVMGFTGEKAAKFKEDFIEAFNKMEQVIKNGNFQIPQTFREALLLAAEQQEVIEAQQRLLEGQKPKVLFADAVIGSKSSCLIGELAKIISQNGYMIGQNRMFEWLRKNGYLGTKGERYNIPNQQYIEQGLFELKKGARSGDGGVMHTTITPKVTGKGQEYFINIFLNRKAS